MIPHWPIDQAIKITGDHVYLIGDAKKPTNAMEAIWAAYETAMAI